MTNEILQLEPRDQKNDAVFIGYGDKGYQVSNVTCDGEELNVKYFSDAKAAFVYFTTLIKEGAIYD